MVSEVRTSLQADATQLLGKRVAAKAKKAKRATQQRLRPKKRK